MSMKNIGKIVQVIGPVVDVTFEGQDTTLPNLLDALVITRENGQKVILECQKHIGEDTVRTIAMDATEGLMRGMPVRATGAAIKMPVGDDIKGRLFNVVGDAVDGMKQAHRAAAHCFHCATNWVIKASTLMENDHVKDRDRRGGRYFARMDDRIRH